MSESHKLPWMSLAERDALLNVSVDRSVPFDRANGDPDFVTTRRSFLKAAGFSFAGAVAASCSRGPASGAVPFIQQPEGVIPGRARLYASTCGACEAGCGVLVTT